MTTLLGSSDEVLLAGFTASDPTTSAAFVERFQRRVYGLALTVVGEPRAAEDVAQEAMVRAWRHGEAFDPRRGSVVTWLLTITRNAAIDALRVRRPVALDPHDLAAMTPPAAGRDPGDVVALHGDVVHLRDALGALPEEQRHGGGDGRDLGPDRTRDRGTRGHPARNREDEDPRRAASFARRARRRATHEMTRTISARAQTNRRAPTYCMCHVPRGALDPPTEEQSCLESHLQFVSSRRVSQLRRSSSCSVRQLQRPARRVRASHSPRATSAAGPLVPCPSSAAARSTARERSRTAVAVSTAPSPSVRDRSPVARPVKVSGGTPTRR